MLENCLLPCWGDWGVSRPSCLERCRGSHGFEHKKNWGGTYPFIIYPIVTISSTWMFCFQHCSLILSILSWFCSKSDRVFQTAKQTHQSVIYQSFEDNLILLFYRQYLKQKKLDVPSNRVRCMFIGFCFSLLSIRRITRITLLGCNCHEATSPGN